MRSQKMKMQQWHCSKRITTLRNTRGELNARARARGDYGGEHLALNVLASKTAERWRRRWRRPPARHDGCARKWQESAHAIVSLRPHCLGAKQYTHAHPGFRLMSRRFKVTERRTRSFGLLATKRWVRLIIGRTAARRVEKFRFTFVSGMSILLYNTHDVCAFHANQNH